MRCDISDEDSVQAMYSACAKAFGEELHILVNNAAVFVFHSVETASAADWDRTSAVNIKGHALMTKHALPMMKKAGGGSIVFQGSISSFLGEFCVYMWAMRSLAAGRLGGVTRRLARLRSPLCYSSPPR